MGENDSRSTRKSSTIANTQTVGQLFENQARIYLENHGLTFVTKNFRCSLGEIDLIMKDLDYLVFIEVRFRKNFYYGDSIETISTSKQHRLIRTALFYLQKNKLMDKVNCRFDVLGMNNEKEFVWVKNAFEVHY